MDPLVEKTTAAGLVSASSALELAVLLENASVTEVNLAAIARYLRSTARCIEGLTAVVECMAIQARLKEGVA